MDTMDNVMERNVCSAAGILPFTLIFHSEVSDPSFLFCKGKINEMH